MVKWDQENLEAGTDSRSVRTTDEKIMIFPTRQRLYLLLAIVQDRNCRSKVTEISRRLDLKE